jgi:large subunit ribosomal protein L17
MRHRIFGRQLNRTSNQRQALFKSLLRSLFTHGAITTTQAKVKSISGTAEQIATLAVKKDLISFRRLNKIFNDRHFVTGLVSRVNTAFINQNSNFFRSDKVGYRQGDNSLLVKISLTKPFIKPDVKKEEKLGKTKSTSIGKAVIKKVIKEKVKK